MTEAVDLRSPRRRWLRRAVLLLVAAMLVAGAAPRLTTWLLARGDVAHVPTELAKLDDGQRRAAIVLGAGLVNRSPSPLLSDRINGAVELLDAGRVDLLVMSGDNTTPYYDEPSAMRRRAIAQGVPMQLVAVDYAGRRTWDTCVRARTVFGITDAVVVTSAFHVDRAIAACRAAGIDATGYSVSDARFSLRNRASWRLRELAASGRALYDAWYAKPAPAVGGAAIDPYDPCELYGSLAPSVQAQPQAITEFGALGCAANP